MPVEPHPGNVLTADLVDTFTAGTRRLEGIVGAGLRRGLDPSRIGTLGQRRGDATLAYRQRQLEQARAVLDELEHAGRRHGPIIVGASYRSGLVAVDRTIGDVPHVGRVGARGAFGRVHLRALEALAGGMDRSLRDAVAQTRQSLELVFERADALEGALPASGRVSGVRFLGRRQNDPYRKLALETVAGGVVGLDTRRQVSASLARRLVADGVTDAVTGFVDRSGRRWPLDRYAAMVARTTTREAMTAATTNRLRERGVDLVTVSAHLHPADECTPYEGKTFSLDGATPGYPRLDRLPPFHPNCVHVLGPASADLDAFERELEEAARGQADAARAPSSRSGPPVVPNVPTPPAAPPRPSAPRAVEPPVPPGPGAHPREPDHAPVPNLRTPPLGDPDPPFPAHAVEYDLETVERLEQQRVAELVTRDPGREPGLDESFYAVALRDERRRVRAVNAVLGPDAVKALKRRELVAEDVRGRLLRGELTVDEVLDRIAEHEEDLWRQAQERELRRRPKVRATPCFHCGRFKSRASSVCASCGDDPVSGIDASDYLDAGYVEGAGGTSFQEGAGITEARRRFDVDFYGIDPDDPNLDPDGPAIGGTAGAQDAYSRGARRRRAMNAVNQRRR